MRRLYGLACILAALSGFVPRSSSGVAAPGFPGWPTTFEGRALRLVEEVPAGFPGRCARFTGGPCEVVVRWVHRPSRGLHPNADCFRGSGVQVSPGPLWRDAEGRSWGTFRAAGLRIRELIRDEEGRSWPEVSEWYWAALLDRTEGPWWVYTVVEREGVAPAPRRDP